jgi:hypothetical protein
MLHSPASQQTAGCPCSVLPTVPTPTQLSPVRRKRGSPPFPTTTAFPPLSSLSPISPTLPTAPTLFAHTTQVLHILTPNLLYPVSAGPDSRHNHHHHSSLVFFSLSSPLILSFCPHQCYFFTRATETSLTVARLNHSCLLRTPPLT